MSGDTIGNIVRTAFTYLQLPWLRSDKEERKAETWTQGILPPEGKVALMFLKMYTRLSGPKLMERLNGNIHWQLFCDVRIAPGHLLTNYKLLDEVMSELSHRLKIQQQQAILARAWRHT